MSYGFSDTDVQNVDRVLYSMLSNDWAIGVRVNPVSTDDVVLDVVSGHTYTTSF